LLGGVNSNTFFFFDVVNVAIVSSLLDYWTQSEYNEEYLSLV
jgi:hypothetical protein